MKLKLKSSNTITTTWDSLKMLLTMVLVKMSLRRTHMNIWSNRLKRTDRESNKDKKLLTWSNTIYLSPNILISLLYNRSRKTKLTSKLPRQSLKTKNPWKSNVENSLSPSTTKFPKRRKLFSAPSPKESLSWHRRRSLKTTNSKTLRPSSLQKIAIHTKRLSKTTSDRTMRFYTRQERTVSKRQWCSTKSRWWKKCKTTKKILTTHQTWATVKLRRWKTRENCRPSFSCPRDTPTLSSSSLSSTAPWIFFTKMKRLSCLIRLAEWSQSNLAKNSP